MGLNKYLATGLVSAATFFGGAETRGDSLGNPIMPDLFKKVIIEEFPYFSSNGIHIGEESFLEDKERDVDIYIIDTSAPLVSAQRNLINEQNRKISSLQNYGLPAAGMTGAIFGYAARRTRSGRRALEIPN